MHTHHGSHAFSGKRTRRYDVLARRLMRRVYRRIATDLVATTADGADVLDVGTGPGVLLMELAQRRPGLRLTGLDLSEDMVTVARSNLGDRGTVRAGDVNALPFPDDSFDLVVSSYSAHHWDDPAAAVPEIVRVLRPGGRFVLYDFGHAPYEAIDGAASGWTIQHDRFRTGMLFFPRSYRHVLTPGQFDPAR